jgi:hypothetical protein
MVTSVLLTEQQTRLEIFLRQGPAYIATYGWWRLVRWFRRRRSAVRRLDEQAFTRRLNWAHPELAAIRQAASGSATDVSTRLYAYFRARSAPRFLFAAVEIPAITALVTSEDKTATLRSADQVCQNTFQFRRVAPVRFEARIDWNYQPGQNADWNRDLNRHLYFETLGRAYAYTGDERYPQKFRDLLLNWLANNPARSDVPSWSSPFEVAFRINTWLWAFFLFRQAAAFDEFTCRALLEGLARHGEVLNAELELHAANNHVLLEAKALAMLGLVFPEFRSATHWRRRGLRLLFRELRAQMCQDGVHGERVTHYQRAIAGEILELFILLDNNGYPLPRDAVQTLGRMVEYELWVTKPDGLLPLFGDSALEDTHQRFSPTAAGPAWLGRKDLKLRGLALSAADIWLLGSARSSRYGDWPIVEASLTSRAFPHGGYLIMRHGHGRQGTYLALDVAPFGYPPVPTHGHADALNVELCAYGQSFLVDPGVFGTWVPPAWRNYFRGTRAHNCVVVDEQDQSLLVGTRHVYRPAQVKLLNWVTSEHFDLADASHNGYERLPGSVTHRRQVVFIKPEYWLVFDIISGSGEHTVDLLFHFLPGLDPRLEPSSGAAQVGQADGPQLLVAPLSDAALQAQVIMGAREPIQGWTAMYSGEKQPAPVLRYRYTGQVPVQFCTVLYPSPAGLIEPIQVSELPVRVAQGQVPDQPGQFSGCQVTTAQHRDLFVLDRSLQPRPKTFAGQSSQAMLVFIRQDQRDQILKRIEFSGQTLNTYIRQ